MYRDFQENTINSDGSFSMWIVVISAMYCSHAIYSYYIPWYWHKNASVKNGEEQRVRMRDALNSGFIEDGYGIQFAEWGFAPHSCHHFKTKLLEGHLHPDDARQTHLAAFNRKNRYREHYANDTHNRMLKPI